MTAQRLERPTQDLVRGYRELLQFDSVTCALSDCMGRFGAMTADMRPLFDAIRFAGPAVTARTLASDLAAVFKAIDISTLGARIQTIVNKLGKHTVASDTFNQTATSATVSGFATGADFVAWPMGTEGEWNSLQSFFSDTDLNPPQKFLYLGGSITGGGSSTSPFTIQVEAWMRASWPQIKYVKLDQHFSGRGSWTQLINMANIVAAQPKLIFIDYAVNDTEAIEKSTQAAAEAFIRLVRTKLPNTVISCGILLNWKKISSHDSICCLKIIHIFFIIL